jgi:hypothetical protein
MGAALLEPTAAPPSRPAPARLQGHSPTELGADASAQLSWIIVYQNDNQSFSGHHRVVVQDRIVRVFVWSTRVFAKKMTRLYVPWLAEAHYSLTTGIIHGSC